MVAKKVSAVKQAAVPADLERAMIEGNEDAFLVYADLLIQRGDPRGELVHVQHQRAQKPKDRKLLHAELALWKKHDALSSPLVEVTARERWRLGFLENVLISLQSVADVGTYLDHPSARFLRELEIETTYDNAAATIVRLAKTPKPALRKLRLSQHYSGWDTASVDPAEGYPTGWSVSKCLHKKGDKLWTALRGLEELAIGGFGLFHTLALPELQKLEIEEGYPFCTKAPPWQLPRLASLTWALQCDETGTGVDFGIETLDPLLDGKLPALRFLDLHQCLVGYVDEDDNSGSLLDDKPFMRIVRKLEVLRLGKYTVGSGDAMVALLKRHAKSLAHLKELGIAGTRSAAVAKRVREFIPGFAWI